ncbi:hypothetical protein M5X11_16085 [Paenibacillus alginolyticus]|uniref:hypothetical protein n=1 Tax=Paenibacillus alginolyticus TaxID=59839 RepID=UPI00042735FC|nr:hypothetical protein [Paenibacillus alginolyticus]MCY9666464.1 hypothetical protein [Paenibacillus alginolyticus]
MNKMKMLALLLKSFILCLFVGAVVKLIGFLTNVDNLELTFLTSANVALVLVAAWGLYQGWGRSRALVMLNVGLLVVNVGLMVVINVIGLDTVKAMING